MEGQTGQPHEAANGNGGGRRPAAGSRAPERRPPRRRQASPIELAAILMDTVCAPGAAGETAVAELGEVLRLPRQRLQSELMYVRAFAVDFAAAMALGDSAERRAIMARYYEHWDHVAAEAGPEVLGDLEDRLQRYAETVAEAAGPDGLAGQVGRTFAACCDVGAGGDDLAMLGGAMFAALFEEVCDLLANLEIVLFGEE